MEWGEFLQPIFEILIAVMLPIFLGFAIGATKNLWATLKAKIPAEQYAFAEAIAKSLVLAAEQNGLSGKIKNEASAKYAWALTEMERELAELGIKLDLRTLSNMIEAAVKAELNMEKTSASG